jgi:hypothetical protein
MASRKYQCCCCSSLLGNIVWQNVINIYRIGQTSGMSSPHQNKERSSYQHISSNSFWGTSQKLVDLGPLDFYLWIHLEALVYSAPIYNEETIHQHSLYACQIICTHPKTYERVWKSTVRHVCACINSGGGCFEHLLWTVTWYTIQTQQLLNWECVL